MTAARRCKVLGKWRLTEADQWDSANLDLISAPDDYAGFLPELWRQPEFGNARRTSGLPRHKVLRPSRFLQISLSRPAQATAAAPPVIGAGSSRSPVWGENSTASDRSMPTLTGWPT